MVVTIRQIHPRFVGEVTGVDIREKLTRQEADAIEAGMDKYAVLIFRNQDITDEQQLPWRAISVNARTLVAARSPRERITGSVRLERCLKSRQGRQTAAARSPHPSVQSWQLPLALRQFVPADPRKVFTSFRADRQSKGRQY
jgi:hypothetical protein